MATLPYADGEIGEDILAEQSTFIVPHIKYLINLKSNRNKEKKMKPFPVPFTISYKTTLYKN